MSPNFVSIRFAKAMLLCKAERLREGFGRRGGGRLPGRFNAARTDIAVASHERHAVKQGRGGDDAVGHVGNLETGDILKSPHDAKVESGDFQDGRGMVKLREE